MAATLAALTPFQTPVDDAWLQVEKKDGRRSSFTILGVASFANGDLSSASQNVAVIFKVCSASRVNHLPRFFVLFLFFMSFTRLHKHLVLFFYFMFHNFHPQNLFKQAACFQTVKATIGAFFYFFKLSTKQNTVVQTQQESIFVFYIYISAPFYVLVFLFFPRACEWDMSKRCSESRTSIFDFVYPNLVLSECSSASYFYKHCNSL